MSVTPEQQKIIDEFDAATKKRAKELLGASKVEDRRDEILASIRESAFCLGYKAGVIDLGAAERQVSVVRDAFIDRLMTVYTAACAWRDGGTADTYGRDPKALDRLFDAIDEARKTFS